MTPDTHVNHTLWHNNNTSTNAYSTKTSFRVTCPLKTIPKVFDHNTTEKVLKYSSTRSYCSHYVNYPLKGKSSLCVMCLKYRMDYVKLLKPNFSSRGDKNSRCRRFYSICCRYDRSCRHSGCRCVAGDQLNTRFFCTHFWVFSPGKNLLGQTEMRLHERKNDNRYAQFEISPETIEQELRPAVCKQRQTDRQI